MNNNGRAADDNAAFSVTAEQLADGVRLVLQGDLDLASVRDFERAVAVANGSGPATMVIDLSGLAFLDSRGLRSILAARESCEEQGCELRLIAGEQSRRLFDMTGLSETLPLFLEDGTRL